MRELPVVTSALAYGGGFPVAILRDARRWRTLRGVVGVLSVKKTLYNREIEKEFVALKGAADLCHQENRRGPYTGLFAFSAEEEDDTDLGGRIFKAIKNTHESQLFDPMVNEASVMARTCVFKNRPKHTPQNARYIRVDCRSEPRIPLQRLLQSLVSVYYDETRGSLIMRVAVSPRNFM